MTGCWMWVLALVPVGMASACSARFGVGDCEAEGTCVSANGGTDGAGGESAGVASSDGSTSGGGDDGRADPSCQGDVADDPTCWASNEYGVFVSNQTGDDETGDGTKEAPFATIGKGLDGAAGKKVYVCLGDAHPAYEEELIIAESRDGASIYGGFECESWNYSSKRKAALRSTTNIGLRALNLKRGLRIQNLRIFAKDATGTGPDASSYGLFAIDSVAVELKNVEVSAGKGATGADGDAGASGMPGEASGDAPQGSAPICSSDTAQSPLGGTWSAESVCGSLGGAGATARLLNPKAMQVGVRGKAGAPNVHVSLQADLENGGLGETAEISQLDGRNGARGDDGAPGAPAAAVGRFDLDGFSTADGASGTDGYPGQGGGGGGSSVGSVNCYGASGGAGGMGGCGGLAGKGGFGGGASVALFSWHSEIALDECTLAAAAGGAGGAGGTGGLDGAGASGGKGGASLPNIRPGGRGGLGGGGGTGGPGSGGSGGPSISIVWSGNAPNFAAPEPTLVNGPAGDGGRGGKHPVSGSPTPPAPAGATGMSLPILEVK
jgi:hypothetical protein